MKTRRKSILLSIFGLAAISATAWASDLPDYDNIDLNQELAMNSVDPDTYSVRRVKSRQRRFLAPGSFWDVMVGIEILYVPTVEFRVDFYQRYPMDYLFGGQTALLQEIAANNAAAEADRDTRKSVGEAAAAAAALAAATKKKKKRRRRRSDIENEIEDEPEQIHWLARNVGHDQVEVYKNIETSLSNRNLNGSHCLLRAICETAETPIHHGSVMGDVLSKLLIPKEDENIPGLGQYREAAKIGRTLGECWSFYPKCPFSLFTILPNLQTTPADGEGFNIEISMQDFGGGSDFGKDEFDLMKKMNEKGY